MLTQLRQAGAFGLAVAGKNYLQSPDSRFTRTVTIPRAEPTKVTYGGEFERTGRISMVAFVLTQLRQAGAFGLAVACKIYLQSPGSTFTRTVTIPRAKPHTHVQGWEFEEPGKNTSIEGRRAAQPPVAITPGVLLRVPIL